MINKYLRTNKKFMVNHDYLVTQAKACGYRSNENSLHGFTLIELLVCALIFGILMVGYSSLFAYAIKSWQYSLGNMDRKQSLMGGIDRLGMDLRSIDPPYVQLPGVGMEGKNEDAKYPLTSSQQDEIFMHVATWCDQEGWFIGNQSGSDPRADMQRVCYWLRQDAGDAKGRVSFTYVPSSRTDYPRKLVTGAIGSQHPYILNAIGFNVEYYDGLAWANTWNSTVSGLQPELIRVTITSKIGNDSSTIVSVYRPMARETKVTL